MGGGLQEGEQERTRENKRETGTGKGPGKRSHRYNVIGDFIVKLNLAGWGVTLRSSDRLSPKV